MAEESLVERTRRWVLDKYPYNSGHLVRTLEWVDRLAPGSSEAVRLAALTHDMERAFPGPDQPITRLNDVEYYRAHSDRSARIVSEWLRQNGASPGLADEVSALIRLHEFGGNPNATLVQAADSLSFLETNIDLFLDFARSKKYAVDEIRVKFQETLDRIELPLARALAAPLAADALRRLDQQEHSQSLG
jgi:hypothetical protein